MQMRRSVSPVLSDVKGMTVFNTEETDTKKQPMFFGRPLGVQRYDSYKYHIFVHLKARQKTLVVFLHLHLRY